MIHKPDPVRLFSRDVLSGHRQLFCPSQPNRLIKRMNDLYESQVDFSLAEYRVRRREPDIAESSQIKAAGDRRTVHHGNCWLTQFPKLSEYRSDLLEISQLFLRRPLHQQPQIKTRTKTLACSGDQHRCKLIVAVGFLERPGKFADQIRMQRISLIGSIESQLENGLNPFTQNHWIVS